MNQLLVLQTTCSPREQLVAMLPKLLLHAARLTRSKQVAEDLVQNTCVRAIERQHQHQGDGRFDAWVVRIMESIWFNELRQKQQRKEQEIEDPDQIPSQSFENGTNAKIMLGKLYDRGVVSEEDFSLIMKIHLHGFTYRELASEYDIPIGTLLSRVSRAKASLKTAGLTLDREAHA